LLHVATAFCAEIQLRPDATARGQIVRLGDVADVAATTEQESSRLAAIELAASPIEGSVKVIELMHVEDALAAHGVVRGQIRLTGASRVRVRRAVEKTAANKKQPNKSGIRAVAGAQVDDAEVIVARRALTRGEVISADDLMLASVSRRPQNAVWFADKDDLVGRQVVRAVAAGQPVDEQAAQPQVLVKRGEVVTVYAHAAGVRVKATARAKQNGSRGELIEVESLADRKVFFARVRNVQEVEVVLGR
jgi:flagella basal body P-ring formation protein FlgA